MKDLEDVLECLAFQLGDSHDPEPWKEMSARTRMIRRRYSFPACILGNLVKMFGRELLKIYVAEIDRKVVGFMRFASNGKVATLVNGTVHPSFRRKGIATALMKATLDDVRKKVSKAVGHRLSTNYIAKKWHTKFGFREFERLTWMSSMIDSTKSFSNTEVVKVRDYNEELDFNSVCELIKHPTDPTLKSFLGKKDLCAHIMSIIGIVRCITHDDTSTLRIVAIGDERLVGYATLRFVRKKREGQITDVYVAPGRKSGIEEALIQAGLDRIKSLGAQRVVVKIFSRNKELIESLEELGFKKLYVVEGVVLDFNKR